METVRLLFFNEPGKSHIGSVKQRAELNITLGILKAMPKFEVIPGRIDGFWVLALTVPIEDKPFWLGFSSGMDFCVNNRQIAVGSKE